MSACARKRRAGVDHVITPAGAFGLMVAEDMSITWSMIERRTSNRASCHGANRLNPSRAMAYGIESDAVELTECPPTGDGDEECGSPIDEMAPDR
jgi:hypothetical protein